MSDILTTWRLLVVEAIILGLLSILAFRLERYTLARLTAQEVRRWEQTRIDALGSATVTLSRLARVMMPISLLGIASLILIAILKPEEYVYNLALAIAAGYVYVSIRHFAHFVQELRDQVQYLAARTDR